MRTSNHTGSPLHRKFSRIGIKRSKIVILLSVFLAILGSLTLSSAAFQQNALFHRTTISSFDRHVAVKTPAPVTTQTLTHTQMPTRIHPPTLSPTRSPSLNQPLGYPLFNGNTHLPEIALTFDDGPNPYYTPQVMAILQQYGVVATFFDVGYLVRDYPGIVRQEYLAGNLVEDHSWSHPELTRLSAPGILSQLTSTSNAIQAAIGVRPIFFRPPYGSLNRTVLAQASFLGVATVLWDDTANDWRLPGVDAIISGILRLAHNGAIILLHDGGGNRAQTVAALPAIITTLLHRGFKFVTIQQLLISTEASKVC